MTTAERIATRIMGDRGTSWETKRLGIYMPEYLARVCSDQYVHPTLAWDRYEFEDGSAIIVTDSGWDIAAEGCEWCWDSEHDADYCRKEKPCTW